LQGCLGLTRFLCIPIAEESLERAATAFLSLLPPTIAGVAEHTLPACRSPTLPKYHWSCQNMGSSPLRSTPATESTLSATAPKSRLPSSIVCHGFTNVSNRPNQRSLPRSFPSRQSLASGTAAENEHRHLADYFWKRASSAARCAARLVW
jgi:hypothetical protein